jgi:hypothetical protein
MMIGPLKKSSTPVVAELHECECHADHDRNRFNDLKDDLDGQLKLPCDSIESDSRWAIEPENDERKAAAVLASL